MAEQLDIYLVERPRCATEFCVRIEKCWLMEFH
jgi:hypothetical protein